MSPPFLSSGCYCSVAKYGHYRLLILREDFLTLRMGVLTLREGLLRAGFLRAGVLTLRTGLLRTGLLRVRELLVVSLEARFSTRALSLAILALARLAERSAFIFLILSFFDSLAGIFSRGVKGVGAGVAGDDVCVRDGAGLCDGTGVCGGAGFVPLMTLGAGFGLCGVTATLFALFFLLKAASSAAVGL